MSSLEILLNSPALHSLKRSQLVYHCKRHGLKASGKNVDMVGRLQDFAKSLPSDFAFPCDEPMDECLTDDGADDGSSPTKPQRSNSTKYIRISEAWSIIEEDSREEENIIPSIDSKRSIKTVMSATSSIGEFGGAATPTSKANGSVGSSIKAIAGVGSSSLRSKKSASDLILDVTPFEVPPSPSPSVATEPDIPIPSTSCPDPELGPTSIRLIASDSMEGTPPMDGEGPYEDLAKNSPDEDDAERMKENDVGSSTFWSYAEKRKSSLYPELPEFARLNAVTSAASLVEDGFPLSFPAKALGPPGSSIPTPNAEPEASALSPPLIDISSPNTKQVAASILEEMNRRMGVAPTSTAAATLSIFDKDNASKFAGTSLFAAPASTDAGRFEKAHNGLLQQMDSIVNHYAARRPHLKSKARKSTGKGLGLGGKKRSSLSATPAAAKRRSRASMAGQRPSRAPLDHKIPPPASSGDPGPSNLAFTMTVDETEGGRRSLAMVEPAASSADQEMQDEDGDEMITPGGFVSRKPTLIVQPTNAARKKIFQAKAKRRSSVGRAGMGRANIVGTGSKPAQSVTSRFGFLKSSANLVKSVFGAAVGAGPSIQQPSASKPSGSANKVALTSEASKSQRTRIFGSKLTTSTFASGPSQVTKVANPNPPKANATGSGTGSRTDEIQLRRHITVPKGGTSKQLASQQYQQPPARDGGLRPPAPGPSVATGSQRKAPVARVTPSTTLRPLMRPTGVSCVTSKDSNSLMKIPARTLTSAGSQRLASSIGPTVTTRKNTAASASGGSLGPKTTRTSSLASQAKPPSRLFSPTASSMAKLQARVPPPSTVKMKADENQRRTLSDVIEVVRGLDATLVTESAMAPPPLVPPPIALEPITNVMPVDDAQMDDATDFGMQASASSSNTMTSSHSAASMGSKSGRRPRIERSKVIAKLGEKRAMDAAHNTLASISGSRQSAFEPFALKGLELSFGQASGSKSAAKQRLGSGLAPVGDFTPGRRGRDLDSAVQMSAKRAIRRSEVLRHRTHASFDSKWEGLQSGEGASVFTNEV